MRSPVTRAWIRAVLAAPVVLCAVAGSATAWERACLHCDLPFAWDDDAAPPPVIGPFPQGFSLTVPIAFGAAPPAKRQAAALARYVDVAAALGRCLAAMLRPDDARWRDLTLRLSFRRDGQINGTPRIAHVSDEPGTADPQQRSRLSLLSALPRCTPLAFSPSLGQAIAGQVFAIRFVQQRNS